VLLSFSLFTEALEGDAHRGAASSSSLAASPSSPRSRSASTPPRAWLAFILVLFGQIVRTRTASGAQRAIEQLVALTPDHARLVTPTGERAARSALG
jgi:cation transport ATPase